MTNQQQSDVSFSPTLTLSIPAPRVPGPAKPVEIVRAESELLAIDELMAELTDDFVPKAKS